MIDVYNNLNHPIQVGYKIFEKRDDINAVDLHNDSSNCNQTVFSFDTEKRVLYNCSLWDSTGRYIFIKFNYNYSLSIIEVYAYGKIIPSLKNSSVRVEIDSVYSNNDYTSQDQNSILNLFDSKRVTCHRVKNQTRNIITFKLNSTYIIERIYLQPRYADHSGNIFKYNFQLKTIIFYII